MSPLRTRLSQVLAAGLMGLATTPARAEPAPACSRAGFHIVLDIGHTTDDTGAMSSHGVSEFAYNQVLALEIDQRLVEMGFPAPLLLLEAGPGKRSLDFAKRLGRAMQAHGLAHTPHYAERFMGRYRREPLDAATGVYRYDRLHVLRTARMPAVLLEAGSILNRAEALDLQTPERRAAIVAAVTEAIDGYCGEIKRPVAVAKAHRKHRLARRAAAQPRETAPADRNSDY